ncbi:hypothetical protein V5E97_34120 [Singulisphaera sp. Ch08]|uniref:Uncharacterized protein n=1 Tax=Singulisphaera sp. Ch08 TaxID=3120278 RepID=A0AAU7CE89_9BACT
MRSLSDEPYPWGYERIGRLRSTGFSSLRIKEFGQVGHVPTLFVIEV